MFTPTAATASIANGDIDAFLDAGTSVTINTSSAFGSLGAITEGPGAAITKTAGGDVTLAFNATDSITLSEAINSTSGRLAVVLNAGTTESIGAQVNTNGGDVTLTAGGVVSEAGAGLVSTTGTLTTSSIGGSILGGANTVGFLNATNMVSGNVFLTNAGPLVLTGISESGGGSITVSDAGSIGMIGSVSAGSGGAINLNASVAIVQAGGGLVSTTGTLTTNSGGGVLLSGANTVPVFNATNSTSGDISLTNSGALIVSGISQAGGGAITINNSGPIAIGGAVTAGSGGAINLTALGELEQNAIISTSGTLTTNTRGGTNLTGSNLAVPNAVGTFNATNTSSGDVSLLNAAGPLTLTGISQSGGGSVTVNNTGPISLTGTIATFGGNVTLTAGGGAITVGGSINAGAGAVLFNSAVVLGSDVTVTASTVNFGSDLSIGAHRMTIDGNATFNSSGTFAALANGAATAGVDYSLLATTGNVALGGATLSLNVTYGPASGDTLTIVETSSGVVTGNFAGLPEGATITANGHRWRIHYGSASVSLNFVPPAADLAVSKTGPASTVAGDPANVTYNITVTNNGLGDAQAVVLIDFLPAGESLVSQSQTSGPSFTLGRSGSTLNDSIGSLGAGASASFSVVAHVSASLLEGTVLSNTAVVRSGTTDPDTTNNDSTASTLVHAAADLAVTKTGPASTVAGDPGNVTYTITVTNNGLGDAQAVVLSDSLPAGESLVSQSQTSGPSFTLSSSGNTLNDSLGSLGAGASASFSVVAHVSASLLEGTVLSNTAVVSSSTTDPDTTNNDSTASTLVHAAITPGASLTVTGGEAGVLTNVVVGTFTYSDPSAVAGDFQATITWGDGSSVAGVVSGSGKGPYTIAGSHTYGEEGVYAISVAVTDSHGSSASLTGTAKIADPPVSATGGFAVTGAELVDTGGQTVATFTDPAGAEPSPSDPSGTHYTATVDWGDGTTSAGIVSGPDATGTFTVTGHHTYSEEGAYHVVTTIHHEAATDATAASNAQIKPRNGELVFARATLSDPAAQAQIDEINADGTNMHVPAPTTASDLTPAWSADGAQIAFSSSRGGYLHIYKMNPDGSGVTQLTSGAFFDVMPSWSPDGRFITFSSNRAGLSHLFVLDTSNGAITQLTNGAFLDTHPVWSPDGTRILFTSTRSGLTHIFSIKPDGTGLKQLTSGAYFDDAANWSPNGSLIVFSSTRGGGSHIYLLDAAGHVTALTSGPAVDTMPVFSPDGQLIAFVSTRGGRLHIFVMHVDGSAITQLTGGAGYDTSPSWRAAE